MTLPRFPDVLLPNIPKQDFCITAYGAVPDGKTYNTHAINTAIAEAANSGGGRIVIPAGLWRTGAINIKSNIELHLKKGALLQFDYDHPEDYPLILTNWEGMARIRATSPINAKDAESIAITGDGIIDGYGEWWRPRKRMKFTEGEWRNIVDSGGIVKDDRLWYPSQASLDGETANLDLSTPDVLKQAQAFYRHYRPCLVSFVNCKRILLEGVTFQNSPVWNIHLLFCEHITVRNMTIRNPWNSQNGDGLDLESVKYALVENVQFDVGDDAICLKAGKNAEGRSIRIPTEFVTIRDCVVYHGHGGFVVGSEMSRGVRNVHVSNCTFIGTDTGIRFKTAIGRGGVVEDILMENINMINIKTQAIIFTMGYSIHNVLTLEEANEDDIPILRNMTVKNVICVGADVGIQIDGLEQSNIHGLTFDNVHVTSKNGVRITHAKDITFINSNSTQNDVTVNLENI